MKINDAGLFQNIKEFTSTPRKLDIDGKLTAQSKIDTGTQQDTYHKSPQSPSLDNVIYQRPLAIESYQSESALIDKMTNTITFGELPSLFRDMQQAYLAFKEELSQSSPSLASDIAEKNWGFSVAADGLLVVSGDLSDNQKLQLESMLNANDELVRLANEAPDILIKGQEYDRGHDGKGQYWGKYDVTRENFKDIIDIKELLDYSYTERENAELQKNNFDIFLYQRNLATQLQNKADARYGYS